MKNPLRYQLSEYDCGPTSMLNALAFLFEREDIPPEAVRNIMLYCLDCYGSDGVSGKSGTSCAAMMFLSNWLNGFGKIGRLHISTQYLSGPAVNFGQNSRLRDALRCGGAAVVRLHFDGEHYVTLTGIDENDMVRVFDRIILISRSIRTACRWCTTTRANTTGLCRAPASSVRPTRFTRLARLTPAKPFSCLMTGRA